MKQRWIGLALSVALLAACEGGGRSFESPRMPPVEAHDRTLIPTPTKQLGIFADVRGRIVYGNMRLRSCRILAVDPRRPSAPKDRIPVSERSGEPLGWSSAGSRLLIRREVSDANRDPVADLDLFVLK